MPPKGTIVPPGAVAPDGAGDGDMGAAGWSGAKEDGEEAAPSGPPLEEASVPAANSVVRASGRTRGRARLGVMRRTISDLLLVSVVGEKRRPRAVKAPVPETRAA